VVALPAGDDDLSPSHHWPEPAIANYEVHGGGPVMITIEYRVPLGEQPAFAAAMQELGAIRRRDGAYKWGLMADAAGPERVTEWFLIGSWEEHLRQHERMSVADRAVQDRVGAFHVGDTAPLVRHLVSLGSAAPAAADGHVDDATRRT
jgi:hypothetical protein